jgi:hypothetical protein
VPSATRPPDSRARLESLRRFVRLSASFHTVEYLMRSERRLDLRRVVSATDRAQHAATSTRLLRAAGRILRSSGRSILANIYTSFTEGFDSADFIDAKALLAEWGA